jgi:hypothetical protein
MTAQVRHRWLAQSAVICLALSRLTAAAATCDTARRQSLERLNQVSKPAHGLLEETSPSLPLTERLSRIDNANDHADQCRAVLGPIPRVNCLDGDVIPVTVDGDAITYRGGVVYRNGIATDWKQIDNCDHPALLPWLFKAPPQPGAKGADPKEGCFPNVRVWHGKSGPVDWVFVCHYKHGLHEPSGDQFDFVAMIGSNPNTGETCFFGHDNGKTDGIDIPPPGGTGPEDRAGREFTLKFWNNPAHNTCLRCHADNKPWVVTPHLNQSRLGGDGSMDIIPQTSVRRRLSPQWGYRVIGVVHNWVFPRPKAIVPTDDSGAADSTCTRCHVLNDQEEGLRFAREAVGLGELPQYAERQRDFVLTREPWMPPGEEPHHSPAAVQAVKRYERAFYDKTRRNSEFEILSPCPAPPGPSAESLQSFSSAGRRGIRWTYRNDLGGVPLRDDVRFRVTVSGSDGTSCQLDDIAPQAIGSDRWTFAHATEPGVRYHYSVQAYRYCFDRDGIRESPPVSFSPP